MIITAPAMMRASGRMPPRLPASELSCDTPPFTGEGVGTGPGTGPGVGLLAGCWMGAPHEAQNWAPSAF